MVATGLCSMTHVIRTFGSLVALGFVVLLVGPIVLSVMTALISVVIGITSVFLPFAIVGLLVWIPYQLLKNGREVTWQRTRDLAQGIKQSPLAMPFRLCGGAWNRACAVGDSVRNFNRQAGRFLGIFLIETLSGAAIGLAVGFLLAGQETPGLRPMPLGAILGAAVGAVIAVTRFRPEPEAEKETALAT